MNIMRLCALRQLARENRLASSRLIPSSVIIEASTYILRQPDYYPRIVSSPYRATRN